MDKVSEVGWELKLRFIYCQDWEDPLRSSSPVVFKFFKKVIRNQPSSQKKILMRKPNRETSKTQTVTYVHLHCMFKYITYIF